MVTALGLAVLILIFAPAVVVHPARPGQVHSPPAGPAGRLTPEGVRALISELDA